MVPWGIRNLLNYVKENYGQPEMFITENGVSERNGTLEDESRISFYRDYINNVLKGKEISEVIELRLNMLFI